MKEEERDRLSHCVAPVLPRLQEEEQQLLLLLFLLCLLIVLLRRLERTGEETRPGATEA